MRLAIDEILDIEQAVVDTIAGRDSQVVLLWPQGSYGIGNPIYVKVYRRGDETDQALSPYTQEELFAEARKTQDLAGGI